MSVSEGPKLPNPPGPAGRGQLLSIQYLRAAAAVSVLIHHALWASGYRLTIFSHGVDLFFVISGFLMVRITDETSTPGRFLRNRVLRIVPLYWAATATQLAYLMWSTSQTTPEATKLLLSMVFLPDPGAAAPHYLPVLPVGWTLNYEMFFYALFAATLLFRRDLQMRVLTTLFIGLTLAGLIFRPSEAPIAFWTNPIILEFLAGAWLAAQWHKPTVDASSIAGLIAWGLVSLIVSSPIFIMMGILFAAMLAERISVVRELKFPLLVGDASYSIYLFHGIAVTVCATVFAKLGLSKILLLPTAAIAGLATGIAAYWVLERPLLRYLRKPQVKSMAVP